MLVQRWGSVFRVLALNLKDCMFRPWSVSLASHTRHHDRTAATATHTHAIDAHDNRMTLARMHRLEVRATRKLPRKEQSNMGKKGFLVFSP